MLVVTGATILITCLNYFLLYLKISSRQLFSNHSKLKEYAKRDDWILSTGKIGVGSLNVSLMPACICPKFSSVQRKKKLYVQFEGMFIKTKN